MALEDGSLTTSYSSYQDVCQDNGLKGCSDIFRLKRVNLNLPIVALVGELVSSINSGLDFQTVYFFQKLNINSKPFSFPPPCQASDTYHIICPHPFYFREIYYRNNEKDQGFFFGCSSLSRIVTSAHTYSPLPLCHHLPHRLPGEFWW